MKRWNPHASVQTARHVPPQKKQARRDRWKQNHYAWYNLAVWRKGSKQFLQRNPLCAHCKDEGRITPAVEVDHVIPHRGDWELFIDSGNWQGLCSTHHARKTVRENGGIANGGGPVFKIINNLQQPGAKPFFCAVKSKNRILNMPRPPKHPNLHAIQGTARPDRSAGSLEIDPLTEAPAPPAWLTGGYAVNCWRQRAPQLVALGIVCEIDIPFLGMFCALEGKLIQLWSAGETPKPSTYAQYRAMAGELGVNPLSRQRLSARPGRKPNKFDRARQ